jgi:pantoate--beta-alanine ligase
MWLSRSITTLKAHLRKRRAEGARIGFVPTMGALHEGHLSLIKRSKKESDVCVCSIFVNPTQFNDPKDLEKYPRTAEADLRKLLEVGIEHLFYPEADEIYPEGTSQTNPIDFGFLATTLEGQHRPGHFEGMAQVVERLLSIVEPDVLVMGQKDLQQSLIVKELILRRGLNVRMVVEDTVRESDGLALSSRNVRLSKEGRQNALLLSKALKKVVNSASEGMSSQSLLELGQSILQTSEQVETEYFDIRRSDNLKPVSTIQKEEKYTVLIAAHVDGIRLIDNMIF